MQATTRTALACRNCGAELLGAFCHGCGEPRPDAHELSLKHFIHHAVHEFTHLDSKIFRTLWLLIRRPGLLTGEYWAGRRTPYVRPLRLYILAAAIHLVAMSSSFYRVDLFRQAGGGAAIDRLIERTAARRHIQPAIVEEQLNKKIAATYSALQYAAVLGFALAPMLIYRKRRPHYLEHLTFSLHVYSFYFLLTAAASLFLTPRQWQRSPLPLVSLVYLFFAVRRLYGDSWAHSAWKALVLRLGLFAAEFLALGIALNAAILMTIMSSH